MLTLFREQIIEATKLHLFYLQVFTRGNRCLGQSNWSRCAKSIPYVYAYKQDVSWHLWKAQYVHTALRSSQYFIKFLLRLWTQYSHPFPTPQTILKTSLIFNLKTNRQRFLLLFTHLRMLGILLSYLLNCGRYSTYFKFLGLLHFSRKQ